MKENEANTNKRQVVCYIFSTINKNNRFSKFINKNHEMCVVFRIITMHYRYISLQIKKDDKSKKSDFPIQNIKYTLFLHHTS